LKPRAPIVKEKAFDIGCDDMRDLDFVQEILMLVEDNQVCYSSNQIDLKDADLNSNTYHI
jgi:hypothetical protein